MGHRYPLQRQTKMYKCQGNFTSVTPRSTCTNHYLYDDRDSNDLDNEWGECVAATVQFCDWLNKY